MNILLVDDDDVDRALVTRTLKKGGLHATITEAVSVDTGLKLYRKHKYDIILLDYRMPKRDGIEMMVEIRNESGISDTAIVMMSSSEDEELALECIRAGAQDFITKSDVSETRLRRALLHATTRFDLEEQLHNTYQKVKELAETDSLTGLANRYVFDESLKLSIDNNRRNDFKMALLLFDLDNFKLINDNFGHDIGDLLLKKVVKRIKSCLRGNELFARLGGDEFAITLNNVKADESASLVARRILNIMHKPVDIASVSINMTTSIGIALHPDNAQTSEELFKYADIAMYRAKKLGKKQVCFFEEEMQQKFHTRLQIEMELREALVKNQLCLYFQPIMNPNSNTITGFEALLRWVIHGKVRTPDQFIEIAEESHQIDEIGRWVISHAIETIAKWNKVRVTPWSIAINVSAVQLTDPKLVQHLDSQLQRHNLAPHLVDIELTETALLQETVHTKDVLNKINRLGVRLALDDFGTGYSSVSHLRNYPIHVVKIDRSLMPSEVASEKSISLIKGLVSMLTILGLDIVAEGAESLQHINLCKSLNITKIQGYYYSKPLSIDEVERTHIKIE